MGKSKRFNYHNSEDSFYKKPKDSKRKRNATKNKAFDLDTFNENDDNFDFVDEDDDNDHF